MEINRIEFQSEEVHGAYRAAEKYLRDHGYSFGSSCAMGPTPAFKGDCYVSKWKNLSEEEKKAVDGIITGDKRNGPVYIIFYDGHVPEHVLIHS